MKEKLTLTIEKKTKELAKCYAPMKGTSISKIVENYLESVSSADEDPLYLLGKNPVKTGISDASENHDLYLYSPDK